MSPFAYAVRPNEPCIFVEIFLPKKAELQGILYETLTQGFRRQVVIRHFLNADPGKKQAILEMLGKGWTVFPAVYPAEIEIQAFPRLFFGYSTYEVDGVFLKEKAGQPNDADDDEWYSIVEDRTQLIRLIFKYDCMAGVSLFLPFLPLLPKQILLTNLLTDFPEMTIATDRVDSEMVDHPRRWDIKAIRRFTMTFGIVSSVFDYLTFGVLLNHPSRDSGSIQDRLVCRVGRFRFIDRARDPKPDTLFQKHTGEISVSGHSIHCCRDVETAVHSAC